MKSKQKSIIFLIIILSTISVFSQEYKFGKVTKEELKEKYYPSDSSANAAILFKKRRTFYDFQENKGWILTTNVQESIKIYNKEGYDWATKRINLYQNGGDEFVSIKAYTYNLVNNKVEKTKLSKDDIFTENVNKYWKREKFTMPNLKEGCIVEWEYTIYSPYYWHIDDMVFQYKIPARHIDSQVIIPEYYVFKNQTKGYYPIKIERDKKPSSININSRSREGSLINRTTFSQDKIDFQSDLIHCVVQNVPAIKHEPYVNNIDNYITSLKFELTAVKFPNSVPKYYNTTWEDVTKTIYDSPNFGEQLKKNNYFEDDLNAIVNKTDPLHEKITKVFQFVKNKIKWNGYKSKYTDEGVRQAYKNRTGNVAEINLALIAMLREVDVNANPVLVSTRDYGIPLFPTSDGFNYVIAGIENKDNLILLDATEQFSTPNVLPMRDLNWQGRLIRKNGSSVSINLFPESPTEELVFANFKIDENTMVSGMSRTLYKDLNALLYRDKNNSLSDEELIRNLEQDHPNLEITELEIKNKDDLTKPVIENLKFDLENQVEIIGDKMYFSPLFIYAENENPFKLEKREYPIDFGAPWNEKYSINVEIPEGYSVETIPESSAISLPDNLGSFKYITKAMDKKIQVMCEIVINSPIITANYYTELKLFYKLLIDKELEKVVLTKN